MGRLKIRPDSRLNDTWTTTTEFCNLLASLVDFSLSRPSLQCDQLS